MTAPSKQIMVREAPVPLIPHYATLQYADASKAESTKRAYTRQWNIFENYCDGRGPALPASPVLIANYLADCAQDGLGVSSIEQALAAIAFKYRAQNVEDTTASSLVRATMSGIRRLHGKPPRQAEPILRDDLRAILAKLSDDVRGKRDRALFLLAFALARRQSEVVAFDVSDVRLKPTGMSVTIRHSKTDQTGKGVLKEIRALAETNADVCPVRAMQAWLAAADIQSGPLFRKVDRWGKISAHRMNPRSVAYLVDQNVARIGLDKALYSGHSLRAGFATQADLDGKSIDEIQDVTDHKSGDMVRRYLRRRGAKQSRTISETLEGD